MLEEKEVPLEYVGKRIDIFLFGLFSSEQKEISGILRGGKITRSQIKKWISAGNVSLKYANGRKEMVTKAGKLLSREDIVIVRFPDVLSFVPQKNKPLSILFEDNEFIIVCKPAGIPTHPDNVHKEDTLVQRVLAYCSLSDIGLPHRPGVIHRLDKDTSGIILFAKTNAAHQYFSRVFSDRLVKKQYLALVHGVHIPDSGTIDSPIVRDGINRKKMCVSSGKNSKYAVTHFDVLERFSTTTFVKVLIETGRTHQIRVHFSSIGHPIVGDVIYGNILLDKKVYKKCGEEFRLFLHAESLTFVPPREKKEKTFLAELRKDIQKMLPLLSGKHSV
jgi:23S rRNA pseudouridine1911/1915/1917 synthase